MPRITDPVVRLVEVVMVSAEVAGIRLQEDQVDQVDQADNTVVAEDI